MTSWRELILNNINFRIYWNIEDDSTEEDGSNVVNFLMNMDNNIENKVINKVEQNINRKDAKIKCGIDCAICLIELNNKKRIISKLKCKHLFHKTCINKWFKQKETCPICRYG